MLSRRFSIEVTGISYPLLTITYHGGHGSVTIAESEESVRAFRSGAVYDSLIARGDPMPAPARGRPRSEKLPLEEQIRRRAYELYIRRGNQSGSEYDDWLQAEEEILRAREEVVEDG